MESIFEKMWRLGPSGLVVKAIIAAIVADGLMLAFILLRRTYRKRYFARRDARLRIAPNLGRTHLRQIPYATWRRKAFDRRIVETIALDAFDAAGPRRICAIAEIFEDQRVNQKRIFEARHLTGWRRMPLAGSPWKDTRPEGIPALAEGLRDSRLETRLAALRGLARTACPKRRGDSGLDRRIRANCPGTPAAKRASPVLRGTPPAAGSALEKHARPSSRGARAGAW